MVRITNLVIGKVSYEDNSGKLVLDTEKLLQILLKTVGSFARQKQPASHFSLAS